MNTDQKIAKGLFFFILIIIGGTLVISQGTGTPSTLRVRTDANGYLMAAGAAQTAPYTTSTFNNTRLKTDASGNLLVASAGGIAPADATYITQTLNSGLSAEQAIASLSSGILRGATTTGVITSLGDVLPIANGGSGAATWGAYSVLTNATSSTAAPTVTNDPKFLAGNGSSTATLRAGGVIYDSGYINAGNLADTNFVCKTTTIPANTLKNIGDEIHVIAHFVGSASTDNKVRQINMGFSSCAADATGFTGGQNVNTNATTTVSYAETMVGTILKSASNAQRTYGWTLLSAGAIQGTNIASTSNTDTSAINIGIAYRDSTAGTAGAITLLDWKMVYVPVP